MQVEKVFLTMQPHEDSAVSWYVKGKNPKGHYDEGGYVNASLMVSDCNRTVEIDFGASPENYAQKRAKIRTMIDSLIKFENALLAEMNKPIPEQEEDDE